MIYSATAVVAGEKYSDPYLFVKKQAVASLIGFVCMLVLSKINIEWLKKIYPYFFAISLILLSAILIPGLGHSAGGAKRWISLGHYNFQAGEFVKLMMIVFLAGYLNKHENSIAEFFTGIFKPIACLAIIAFLFLRQPDFGSSAVLFIVGLAMLMAGGARLHYFIASFMIAVACAVVLVITSPYRLSRVTSFMAPWQDAKGQGYQLIQSLIAVGSGNLTGAGLGASQQKLFFLPAAHTDFIFAVISEELGFLGALAVLLVFCIIFWRGMRLAGQFADDTFKFSLTVGLTLLIVVPAFLNIGVVTGLLPTKGMVLPLVGYGGSSLIASMMVIGLLLALSRSFKRQNA